MQPPRYPNLIHHIEGGILVLTFTETLPNPASLDEAMGAAVISTGCARVVLSCRAVRSLASASFFHLLKLRRRLAAAGGRLVLCNVAPAVKEIIQAVGLDEVFEVRADVSAAVDSLALEQPWLAWNGGIVVKLAQTICDGLAFDRLPILLDALEESGCPDVELLAHCRQPGPHPARYCWALSLLAGRG